MKKTLLKYMPIIIMLVYVALMWHFWLSPKFDMLERKDTVRSELLRILELNKKNASQLAKWRQRYEEHENSVRFISKALPDDPNLIGLMSEFAREAADRGLVFSLFSPAGYRPNDFYTAIPVRAKFAGPLDDLLDLISGSLNFSVVVSFKKVSLKVNIPDNGYDLDVQLETYHYRDSPRKTSKKSRRRQ